MKPIAEHVCPSPNWGTSYLQKLPHTGDVKTNHSTNTEYMTTTTTQMTTTTAPTTNNAFPNATVPLTDAKIEAFKLRLKDTNHGWAFAHLLPIAPLIYACQRRTITPWLYTTVGSFAAAFTVGVVLTLAGAELSDEDAEMTGALVAYASAPLLAKKGIDRARKFAAAQLGEDA